MNVQLSQLFTDPALRAAFAAAERDQDTVPATSPKLPRTEERELCTAP